MSLLLIVKSFWAGDLRLMYLFYLGTFSLIWNKLDFELFVPYVCIDFLSAFWMNNFSIS